MDDLYKEIILEHYKHPRNLGNLPQPHARFSLTNELCGDEISMEINVSKAGVIKDIRFQGQGCAISLASASLLTEHVKGGNLDKVLKLTSKGILKLLGVSLNHTRIKCAILPLEVLHKAIGLLK